MRGSYTAPAIVVKTAAEVALFFGVSRQTVQDWKFSGLPSQANGFELGECARWLRERDPKAGRQSESGGGDDLEREEFLKTRADRQLKEIKRDKEIGKLIDRSMAATSWQQFAAVVRSRLQALPGELASRMPPDFRHDMLIEIEQAVALVLTEMASWQSPQVQKSTTRPTTANGGNKRSRTRTSGKRPAKSSRRAKSRRD